MISVHRAYAALAAALLTVSLVACSSDEDPSSDREEPTTPVATTSGTPDVPEPPGLPAAAKEKTRTGAEAFVRHYWQVVDFAMTSGDFEALRSLNGSNCTACRRGMKRGEALHRGGGHQVGGESTVTAQTRVWSEDGWALVATKVTTAPGREYYGKDDPRNRSFSRGEFSYSIHCRWVDGSWSVIKLAADG